MTRRCLAWLTMLALAAATLVAGCGSMIRLAYNHADFAVRLQANDYFDLDGAQSEAFNPRLDAFHAWHRQTELPRYVVLATSARERIARGLNADDVTWAIAEIRARYRLTVSQAIDASVPVLAMLNASNLNALERRFAKTNAELERDYWSGDEARRIAGRMKRLRARFDDWLGAPTPEQEGLLLAYVKTSPNYSPERMADRVRRQKAFAAILREHRGAPDLGERLKRFLVEYERDRAPGYAERAKEWDAALVKLVLDIERTLRPEQRERLLGRLARYTEDFRALIAQGS